jgi:hypothetical protein
MDSGLCSGAGAMTQALSAAFATAAQLPEEQQDVLAAILL